MRGASKIDPTFGSSTSETPGDFGGESPTPAPNTTDVFGVIPLASQTPDEASPAPTSSHPPSQNDDPTTSQALNTVSRSKARRHSMFMIQGSNSSSNSNSENNEEKKETNRRKSTSSAATNSVGVFVLESNDPASDCNVDINSDSKPQPDRSSTSSDSGMDTDSSRSKRVWKAISMASQGISKEKQKVVGFFRNRLRSKRGRKETSVKEIHIDPEIFDDKWASRAASSNSTCSRGSNGSVKHGGSNSNYSNSSRESTTLEVVHDMEEDYNPEYR